jgi:hypothetical protein
MPHQQHVSDVGNEVIETEHGQRWAYQVVIVHVQRRAGKTVQVFVRQTHRAITRPKASCWYGAQSRKDGLEIWDQQTNELLLPHKMSLDFAHRRSIGSESLRFGNGSRIALFTPADTSLVGLSTDLVDVDEARFHSLPRGLALEAGIRPTQATRDGQLWICSSSGVHGQSEWLWRWLQKGKRAAEEGRSTGIAFFDYSIPDDGDPTDLETVCMYHPAVGHTIGREFLAAERDSMEPNDFAREYAGRWTSSIEQLIPAHDWSACKDTDRPQPKPAQLSIAFGTSPDRGMSAIGASWRDGDTPRVAVLDQRPGADWLQPRLVELIAKWKPAGVGYNAVGPAVSIADSLDRQGVQLYPCNLPEYVVACGAFYEAVKARTLRHNAQPDLDEAVAAVAKRDIGERWVWGHRKSAAPIVALEAVTVASWLEDHPEQKQGPATSAVARGDR